MKAKMWIKRRVNVHFSAKFFLLFKYPIEWELIQLQLSLSIANPVAVSEVKLKQPNGFYNHIYCCECNLLSPFYLFEILCSYFIAFTFKMLNSFAEISAWWNLKNQN